MKVDSWQSSPGPRLQVWRPGFERWTGWLLSSGQRWPAPCCLCPTGRVPDGCIWHSAGLHLGDLVWHLGHLVHRVGLGVWPPMLTRPAVRAAAADFEMVRADGGRDDGQDQHDPQYDRRQVDTVATVGSARWHAEKEGVAYKDGRDDGHDHGGHLQASTSTLSSSNGKSARDEEGNCCQKPQSQKRRSVISTEDT